MPAALQLYTVRQALANDFAGTLRRIRKIGYRAVETYPFPPHVSPRSAAEMLKSLGLQVVAMHTELPVGDVLPRIVEEAAELNCNKIIWHGWPRSPEHDSLEGVKRLADCYNEAGAAARKFGLHLGLHNHWWEFQPFGDVYPYQLFRQILHPNIFFEIDTYWVQTAGLDPGGIIAELEESGPRVQFLHLKDGPIVQGQPMVPLGKGAMDFPSILKRVTPLTQLVVELDECATDIFQAIEQSLRYLETLERQLGYHRTLAEG